MGGSNAEKATREAYNADIAALVGLLAESRARFADSEARRAELEAVIEKVRERLVTLQTNSIRGGWASRAAESILRDCLSTTRSVVLEDRDREVAARELEATADQWVADDCNLYAADRLRERAAAIRPEGRHQMTSEGDTAPDFWQWLETQNIPLTEGEARDLAHRAWVAASKYTKVLSSRKGDTNA